MEPQIPSPITDRAGMDLVMAIMEAQPMADMPRMMINKVVTSFFNFKFNFHFNFINKIDRFINLFI